MKCRHRTAARGLVLVVASAALSGQGTAPKAKPEGYPVQASAAGVALGAEYLIHSFRGEGGMFVAPDYLVVEAALYPKSGDSLDVNAGHFSLRINGRKQTLKPQAPPMVAASLKYSDWEGRRGLEASAGMGNAGVILGRPQTERFPGDPRQQRLPRPPQAPETENRSGAEKPEPAKAEEVVVRAALPEGPARGPVSGYLYFAYKGKIRSIHSVELLYRDQVLKLL